MRTENKEHKYVQVADGIEQLIAGDILRIGDKLPSVRILSQEHGISLTTAFQAYYHLEGKGLIEARPKSGYYVRFTHRRFPSLPQMLQPKPAANEVTSQDMIDAVFRNIASRDILNFSLAVPAFELLPAAKLNKSVVYALRASPQNCINYEDRQGNLELRKQIAKLSLNWNGKVKAEDVIVTAGCMEALVVCLRSVTKPGDTVAIESPTFFGIFQVMQSLGLKVKEIPTDPSTGIDISYLDKAIKKHKIKACVFVTNFNNPLGSCMPDENKKQLVELITKHGVPLIEDDIYGELYFGKQRPRTCKSFDTEGLVLYCTSLSKSLAPGYRIGWCIPGKFFNKVKELKWIHTISTATLTQVATAHFLSIGRYEYHLKNLRKALHTQSLRYIQAIIEFFPVEVKISRPSGGFVLWLELDKRIDGYKLYLESIKQNISIAPGQIFSSQEQYKNYIRIGFGRPYDKKVEQGLKTLGDLVKRMK